MWHVSLSLVSALISNASIFLSVADGSVNVSDQYKTVDIHAPVALSKRKPGQSDYINNIAIPLPRKGNFRLIKNTERSV